jgi:hypothetical protein
LLTGIPFDCLALFSGGLDSLVGAIDFLEHGRNPLFISHVGDGLTSTAQQNCFCALKDNYTRNQLDRLRVWMNFPNVQIAGSESEKSTRARSFLFFSISIFAGTGFGSPFSLKVPENGLIALNVPLDPLRLGSLSTRTTHPFYIARWNEILNILQIEGQIENPYWNKTKGEMISECANKTLLQNLAPVTLSCSSPSKARWKGHPPQHCGYCLPCLIRRAALEKGFGPGLDTTSYTITNLSRKVLNSLKAEGQLIRSFQIAINRLSLNPKLAKILVHSSGSLSDESPEQLEALVDVYIRGMAEVADILQDVQTKPK